MVAKVENISPTLVKINFEVQVEELQNYFDKVYNLLANQVKIPGFRPGKAPKAVIDSNVGKPAVIQQVINDAIPEIYAKEIQELKIRPFSQPKLELTSENSLLDEKHPLKFQAEVEIRPEVKLPDLQKLKLTVDAIKVESKDVEEALKEIQKRFATQKDSKDGAKEGDIVNLEVEAKVDGKKVADASAKGITHEVGSKNLIKGLDEAVLGLKKGEKANFKSKLLSGSKAGDEADFVVIVNSIKTLDYPKVDEAFVKMASEFDTVKEFKADLEEKVKAGKKFEQVAEISDKLIDELIELTNVPVPENFLAQQIASQNQQVLSTVGFDTNRLNKVLEAEEKTPESFQEEIKTNIEKAVKSQLILDEFATKNKIEVGQNELTERILLQAQQYNVSPQQLMAQLQQSGQMEAIYSDVLRSKAVAEIIKLVDISDEKGNKISADDLFDNSKESDNKESK